MYNVPMLERQEGEDVVLVTIMRVSIESDAPLKTARSRRTTKSTRDTLLSGVYDVLLAEGFSSTSVDDLCRRLRCSKSTLYT